MHDKAISMLFEQQKKRTKTWVRLYKSMYLRKIVYSNRRLWQIDESSIDTYLIYARIYVDVHRLRMNVLLYLTPETCMRFFFFFLERY